MPNDLEKNNKKVIYGNAREVKDLKDLLTQSVNLFGDHIAYKYKKNASLKNPQYVEVTYKDLQKDIHQLGTALMDMGLAEKRIAVIGPNRYEWCVSHLAITTGNMVIVPLDKALPANEIKSLILRSEADAVIFDKKYLDTFMEIKEEGLSNLQFYICMDDEVKSDSVLSYPDLMKKGKALINKGDTRHQDAIIDSEKMSIMLFTSGTTSIAKAVMLSHRNICSNLTAIAKHLTLKDTDTLLSFLPLHHTFESTITFLYGLYSGCTVAFCDGLKYITKNLEEYKVTVFVCVPLLPEAMYKKILKGIEEQGKTRLIHIMTKVCNFLLHFHIDIRRKVFKEVIDKLGGHLRLMLFGAAPMDKKVIIGLNNFGIEMAQGYGLTETSPVLTAEMDHYRRPGSIGLPLQNVELKISNPDENGVGEITAKGPNVMIGYYQNQEATNAVLKDGWFYTGDLGYMDKDGFVYITGRQKDVIVLKNGKNIYPQEIELLINKLPYVAESIVYAKPSKTREGDLELCTKVVYDKDHMKTLFPDKKEEDYYDIIWVEIKKINKEMPPYKALRELIVTDEPLIKTTTQKVKRFEEIKKILAESK